MIGAWNVKKQQAKKPFPLIGMAMAFISGILSAGLWLSWNSDSPIPHYFQRGAPT